MASLYQYVNGMAKNRKQGVNHAVIAEAVHKVVCEMTGNGSGLKECLSYAILGCIWLNKHTDLKCSIVGGKLGVPIKNIDDRVVFEHFWITYRERKTGRTMIVDYATRYNLEIVKNGCAAKESLASAEFDERLNRPYYVGDQANLGDLCAYFPIKEPTMFAENMYKDTDRVVALRAMERIMAGMTAEEAVWA